MRVCIALSILLLGTGCDLRGPVAPPGSRSRAAAPPARAGLPPARSCTPGGEAYAVRIQGFPEYRDTTIHYAFVPQEDFYADAGGPINHPLFRSARQFVSLSVSRDSCGFIGVANQVGIAEPLTIFPDGTHYAKHQLTASQCEADLARGSGCNWYSLFETRGTISWGGEPLPPFNVRKKAYQKDGWRLVLNEEDLTSEWPSANALHLFGPGRREVIVSHVQAFPACP